MASFACDCYVLNFDNCSSCYVFLQFINNNQALATLPNDGVGQNLAHLEPCAIFQPHVHPRGTEVAYVTDGKVLPADLYNPYA